MSEQEYLLDIPMCVYNHGKYIAQAIEGVINQQTDFKYRLIIGEDCSTDNSREIIQKCVENYPSIIKVFFHDKNIGTVENSRILFRESKAKYVALCDGDDYWTDRDKLQKQIDFLEQNPDFAICFHNSRILNEDAPEEISYSNAMDQVEITTFDDLARGEYIYTATCVFRNEHFKKFPEKYYSFMNNYTLDLHNAQFGKIKYINEVMSVYRKHRGGIWSMVARERTLMNQLPTYKFYLDYFGMKYRHYFIRHVKNITNELMLIIVANRDYKNFWRYYKEYVYYNIKDRNKIKRIAYVLLKANYDKFKQLVGGNG
jgi:glycosyltransferase involved in cell wall biosynthesis